MNIRRQTTLPIRRDNRVHSLQNPFKKVSRFSTKPPLSKLYIEPTTQCNLQCRTCIRNSWDEAIGFMNMATYRKLLCELKELPQCTAIAFWGYGEPLMHPEIVDMVNLAHKAGIQTEIITNGHLLDNDISKVLIQAGLDTLVVSVDGTTPASYGNVRLGGNLSKVEENIRQMNKLRENSTTGKLSLGLEFVIMKSNIDRLPDLADHAHSMKADFVILTNLLPCTEDMQDEILYWISATVNDDAEHPKMSNELMLPRMDLRTDCLNPLKTLLKRMDKPMPDNMAFQQEYCCPFIEKGSAAIAWTGDVSPCIALMHSYRCYILGREKLIKKYSVGNIGQEKINDIWNKRNYQFFRNRVFNFDFSPCVQCSGCSCSETNEEDCFGNTHPVCGDCLWARSVLLCP